MEKFIPIKLGSTRLNRERLFIKALEKKGLIKPIRVQLFAFTTMFGTHVVKDEEFKDKYYRLGSYGFKVVERA